MDSEHLAFDSLCSNNERLIGEMNRYLASIELSPGGETDRAGPARNTDMHSIKPTAASDSSEDGMGGGVPEPARKGNKYFIAVDETREYNVGVGTDKSHADRSPFDADDDDDDDDSLVAMARGMDDASVISEITVPADKILALPPTKRITAGMKKLGPRRNHPQQLDPPSGNLAGAGATPPPPPPPPRHPPRISHSETSSSAKEHIGHRPASHYKINGQCSDYLPCSDEATSSEHEHGNVSMSGGQVGRDARAIQASPQPRRRHSPLSSAVSTEIGPQRRGSGKKPKKARSPSDFAPTVACPGVGHGTLPAEPRGQEKARSKSRGERRWNRGRKNSQRKNPDSDSDEESMRGTGFNTRIHADPKFDLDLKPNVAAEPAARRHPPSRPPHARAHADAGRRGRAPDGARDAASSSNNGAGRRGRAPDGAASSSDSDDHTQIFYESTDDESTAGEGPAAAGTSVAAAVRDLNERRAVAKVKQLFGLRR